MSDRYVTVAAKLAAEFDAVHVPTQQAFDAVLAVSAPDFWADDRVHPGLPGHAVIAEAFLRAIDA
jgi:lysophospholipase L1-like esterase